MPLERTKLPMTRPGVVHHVEIFPTEAPFEPVDIYIITGQREDGSLGEFFLDGRVDGIGIYDNWATASSIMFQCEYSIDDWCRKFAFTRRQPAGMCKGEDRLRSCSSITDYVARWIGLHYGSEDLKKWILGENH